MRIELCEDNGLLNDGVPTLVVLQITRDDGKVVRVPYQADKTIQNLYKDVYKMTNVPTIALKSPEMTEISTIGAETMSDKPKDEKSDQKVISKEDIVECVQSLPREDIEEDMIPEVGHEYRVIEVLKKGTTVVAYHVLDDKAGTKIRIPMFPIEVKLKKKKPPLQPHERRVMKYSMMKQCECGEDNALILSDDKTEYKGTCEQCKKVLVEKRTADLPAA